MLFEIIFRSDKRINENYYERVFFWLLYLYSSELIGNSVFVFLFIFYYFKNDEFFIDYKVWKCY